MRTLIRFIDRISHIGGVISAICILLMTALIILETSVRLFAGSSIFIAEEYSAYLMANFVMLGLGFTLKQHGHIKVTLLVSRAKINNQHILRLLACLLGIFVFGLMFWELFLMAYDNWEFGQQSMNITRTPIFIPQIGLVLGSSVMVLQFLAELLKEILFLKSSEPNQSTL